jgi:3-dehydroquinate dehydratase-2
MAKHILILNGPNLNLLGHREPNIYGSTTLADIETALTAYCSSLSPPVHISFYQSNHEGLILDRIHSIKYPEHINPPFPSSAPAPAQEDGVPPVDAIIVNAGGLTHTSVVLRDALTGVDIPFIEVHVSNVHAREEFRHVSFLSEKATAVICGLGTYGYHAAVEYCVHHLKMKS